MRLIHPDGSPRARDAAPAQQVVRRWDRLSVEEAADVFQETFTGATILPNRQLLENARARAEESGALRFPSPLVTVNDLWSVYAVGSTVLAVAVQDGEVLSLASLRPSGHRPSRHSLAQVAETLVYDP